MGLPFLTWGWGSPARVQEGCEQDLWAQEASGSPLNLDVHTPTHLQLPWNKKDMKAEIQNIRSVSTGGLHGPLSFRPGICCVAPVLVLPVSRSRCFAY